MLLGKKMVPLFSIKKSIYLYVSREKASEEMRVLTASKLRELDQLTELSSRSRLHNVDFYFSSAALMSSGVIFYYIHEFYV